MEALLSNNEWPEYGSVTVPFPIPPAEYDSCMEMLQSIGIGDPLLQDCRVDKISGGLPVLDCLTGQLVNVDELDFLAKRMKEFLRDKEPQFSAAAWSLGKKNIRDLINLVFCTDHVTVITDFAPDKLQALGKTHYLNINGGAAPSKALENLDGEKMIRDLIASGTGKVTPFGVLYDNGMEFQEVYKGYDFPEECRCETLYAELYGDESSKKCILHFPVPDSAIPRMLIRSGLDQEKKLFLALMEEECPPEVLEAVGNEWDITLDDGVLEDINSMCRAISELSDENRDKLGAVIRFAEPKNFRQIARLAKNLTMFEFVPDVKTPEEYGRFLLRNSGIGTDEKLGGFFDFDSYGKSEVKQHNGKFNERGYVACRTSFTLEELMENDPPERFELTLQERLSAMSRKKDKSRRGKER